MLSIIRSPLRDTIYVNSIHVFYNKYDRMLDRETVRRAERGLIAQGDGPLRVVDAAAEAAVVDVEASPGGAVALGRAPEVPLAGGVRPVARALELLGERGHVVRIAASEKGRIVVHACRPMRCG